MASILAVARSAQVSPSTVSRVINGTGPVKPATRERVLSVAKSLGYEGRLRAQDQGYPDSDTLKLMVLYTPLVLRKGEMTAVARGWLAGVQQTLNRPGVQLTVFSASGRANEDPLFRHTLSDGQIDGAVVLGMGAETEAQYLFQMVDAGLPVVAIHRMPAYGQFSCATVDFYGGARAAGDYLAKLGHQRIAMSISSGNMSWNTQYRLAGMRQAAKDHGLPLIELVMPADTSNRYDQLAKRIVAENITAIHVGDYSAITLIDALEKQGVRVPEQVSVIGFGGQELATTSGLKLTTIGYDKQFLGQSAAELLLQMVEPTSEIKTSTVVIQTSLVDGQTAATLT